jgi:two-component system, NtrC family, response regulator GlrR
MKNLIRHLRDTRTLGKLIGEAPVFAKAIEPLPAIAKCDATVLIEGETGTGKELIARAIHYLSERAAYPFVPINCGSLPEALLEDELFGHERGAFTDAHNRRSGLITQAEKGTLFLDEVDALTGKAQVAFLRVLQDKRFRPVGSSIEQQADVRIVAATNVQLDHSVQNGAFRADLYYRLCVFALNLPPLRERKDDILLLASYFLEKHAPENKAGIELSAGARAALVSYDWPGNVRELENAIIRGIHLSLAKMIEARNLCLPRRPDEPSADAAPGNPPSKSLKAMKQSLIAVFERDYLERLMHVHQGNVSHAAQAAGKDRREFGKLLKKYRLDPHRFHSPNPTPS